MGCHKYSKMVRQYLGIDVNHIRYIPPNCSISYNKFHFCTWLATCFEVYCALSDQPVPDLDLSQRHQGFVFPLQNKTWLIRTTSKIDMVPVATATRD